MLKNWVLSAPNRADRLIGYDGENLARTLAVHVDDPAQWQYKFELRFADGKVNILDAMLHGNVASSALKESYLSVPGPCELQVRGLSGEREIKSNVLGLMLAESIGAGQNFSAPSEFEQLEQNLTNIKEQAVAAAGQSQDAAGRAEAAADRAEAAAGNAEDSAGRAEEAANKAESFSRKPPEIRNGNWWVYNPVSGQYEDSGQKAQGDKGEMGVQGLPGQKGETGAQGEKGDTGEKGEPGEPGEPGAKGDRGEQGVPGEQGEKGENGFSPTVQTTPAEGGVTVTITDHEGAKTFTVKDGAKGEKGERGETGAPGQKGETGARGAQGERGRDFTILGSYESKEALQQAVTSPKAGEAYAVGAAQPYDIYIYDGVTSDWTNHGKLQGAKGDPGEKGEPGTPGAKGEKGDPGAAGQAGAPGAKGDRGEQGVKGADGFSPTVQTTPAEGGTTVTITDHEGAKTFTVKDGAKGEKGEPGQPGAKGEKGDPGAAGQAGAPGAKGDRGEQGVKGADGFSPTVQTTPAEGGTTVTITDHEGAKTFTVKDGAKGEKGEPGQPGAKGERGDPGPQGQTGSQGPRGYTGSTGSAGKSAYQSAQSGGFSGSESTFNSNLAQVGNKIDKPSGAQNGQVLLYKNGSWGAGDITGSSSQYITGTYVGSADSRDFSVKEINLSKRPKAVIVTAEGKYNNMTSSYALQVDIPGYTMSDYDGTWTALMITGNGFAVKNTVENNGAADANRRGTKYSYIAFF